MYTLNVRDTEIIGTALNIFSQYCKVKGKAVLGLD
jgi:hypothetical protein